MEILRQKQHDQNVVIFEDYNKDLVFINAKDANSFYNTNKDSIIRVMYISKGRLKSFTKNGLRTFLNKLNNK